MLVRADLPPMSFEEFCSIPIEGCEVGLLTYCVIGLFFLSVVTAMYFTLTWKRFSLRERGVIIATYGVMMVIFAILIVMSDEKRESEREKRKSVWKTTVAPIEYEKYREECRESRHRRREWELLRVTSGGERSGGRAMP